MKPTACSVGGVQKRLGQPAAHLVVDLAGLAKQQQEVDHPQAAAPEHPADPRVVHGPGQVQREGYVARPRADL